MQSRAWSEATPHFDPALTRNRCGRQKQLGARVERHGQSLYSKPAAAIAFNGGRPAIYNDGHSAQSRPRLLTDTVAVRQQLDTLVPFAEIAICRDWLPVVLFVINTLLSGGITIIFTEFFVRGSPCLRQRADAAATPATAVLQDAAELAEGRRTSRGELAP